MMHVRAICLVGLVALLAACDAAPAPSPTPDPSPTAVDLELLQANPNAITFTIENQSPFAMPVVVRQPGAPLLVGSAEPGVVAPLSTTEVTILVPPKAPWEVVVNPIHPVDGGLFGSTDVHSCRGQLELIIRVHQDGNTSWLWPRANVDEPC